MCSSTLSLDLFSIACLYKATLQATLCGWVVEDEANDGTKNTQIPNIYSATTHVCEQSDPLPRCKDNRKKVEGISYE